MEATKTTFFTKDRTFYKALFSMLLMVALQNIVAYSVNMADNIMLGRYSQDALSGAATVNQIFFMIQQFALSIGNALVVLASQYWGQKRTEPIVKITGIALRLGLIIGVSTAIICQFMPQLILRIFTNDAAIIAEGCAYLNIIKWTFILFIITNVLMAGLRAVGTVKISFYISLVSLVINVGINYILIFGKFGMPEMGIKGAAIGTLIARIVELVIVIVFVAKVEKKIKLFDKLLLVVDKDLRSDYRKQYIPIFFAQVIWGLSIPMQTAILGHLSKEAIAANSVATTFYQYLKVIVVAMSSTSAVMIGNSIGRGDLDRVKSDARTMSVIDIVIGLILGVFLMLMTKPLLSLYNLSPETLELAKQLMLLMGIIMMGMSYQMPVSFGIIMGAGNPGFTGKMNMISTWLIVMPLSFLSAFLWKLPVVWVVLFIQSDQLFKCIPTFLWFRTYSWIRKLTR